VGRNQQVKLGACANGAFAFAATYGTGTAYAVTVAVQPASQSCTVDNGSGTIGTANVTHVAVNCTAAATVNAASCSLADVRAAINAAASGDTVAVPAGNCTWAGSLVLPDSKKITLMGAGRDATIITGDLSFGSSGSRVTGFTFTGNPQILSHGYGFRLDHCRLQRSTWNDVVTVKDYSPSPRVAHGLVDNNEIINGRINAEGTAYLLAEGSQQHQLWAAALDLGGPNAVYIEDNTFTAPTPANSQVAVDANYGGRFVFRYNTVSNGLFLTAHSSQEGGNRAGRSWEIYGNVVANDTATPVYAPLRLRAGTGVIFANVVRGNWSDPSILFDNVRSYAAAGLGGGMCNGSSAWDGNSDASGYPCRDQIGRGGDSLQWNHNPAGAYAQPLIPAYAWLNRSASNAEVPASVISWSSNHIKPNRDYYAAATSFNGTAGVGCGPPAARPATCTVGVGYWATDQSCSDLSGAVGARPTRPIEGTLYRCTAPNTWSVHFRPYTYPHPQRQAGG
jgi:hypothetical protein